MQNVVVILDAMIRRNLNLVQKLFFAWLSPLFDDDKLFYECTLVDRCLRTANFGKSVLSSLGTFQLSSETNDTLFESPYKTLLESGMKMGKAPSTVWQNWFEWKSTTFSRLEISPLSV